MLYQAADVLVENLRTAQAALLTPIPHTLYGHADLSAKGDKAFPPRPSITVYIPQSQPALVYGKSGAASQRLAVDTTRLAILVESRVQTDDPEAQTVVNGYSGEHLPACNFLRDFVLSNHSLTIPASLVATLGDQPLAMRPDDPFDGIPGRDEGGYRHAYFVLVSGLKVLWPIPE